MEFEPFEFEPLSSKLEEFENKLSTLILNEKSLLGQLEVLCEYRSVLIQSSRFLNDVYSFILFYRPSMIVPVNLWWLWMTRMRMAAKKTFR